VFEVNVDGINEIFTVEKAAHRYFDAGDAPLQLKYFDLVGFTSASFA
jgi:hypothetical protein